MASETEELLRRLAAGDEQSLRTALAPTPEFGGVRPLAGQALERRARVLVRLAALVALDAPTVTLRWAVELACTTGADEHAVVGALLRAAPAAGAAQIVASAPRLALALGCELGLD